MDAGSETLASIRMYCQVMYVKANDPVQLAEAQRRIVPLGESAECIPLCQHVIEHSTKPYALLVGAHSLTRLITSHWNSFTVQQRVDIRTCVHVCCLPITTHRGAYPVQQRAGIRTGVPTVSEGGFALFLAVAVSPALTSCDCQSGIVCAGDRLESLLM